MRGEKGEGTIDNEHNNWQQEDESTAITYNKREGHTSNKRWRHYCCAHLLSQDSRMIDISKRKPLDLTNSSFVEVLSSEPLVESSQLSQCSIVFRFSVFS